VYQPSFQSRSCSVTACRKTGNNNLRMKLTNCHDFISRPRVHGDNPSHHQCSYVKGYWLVWNVYWTAVIMLYARWSNFTGKLHQRCWRTAAQDSLLAVWSEQQTVYRLCLVDSVVQKRLCSIVRWLVSKSTWNFQWRVMKRFSSPVNTVTSIHRNIILCTVPCILRL
jgi:hypothetical protein